MGRGILAALTALVLVAGCNGSGAKAPDGIFVDGNESGDWTGYGNTYGEQHFSTLTDISSDNVGQLGLAWSYDLPPGNSVSGPIAVDGVLYTATGYSIVRAFDATSGKLLWEYDPKAPEKSGIKLRQGWGIRGLAYWNGKIIVGTQDGRLVGVDAKTGKEIWSQLTVQPDDYRFISGAPRVFDGKVIIGHGGADSGATRGYVTTYDADTGKQLWRFFTVPGNPADGFEDKTQEMIAKTWSGKWWEHGGGGTVWNTFTYDPETKTIFLGVGNGAPWNHKIRSEGKGDNLFLCSVVALDADTGKYKWHYQFNPGETWDYNAAMDMHLANVTIDGKPRKVLVEMPKNGFFYVIDRLTGKLISAEKVAEVTWATGIDMKTGRPIEVPAARELSKPFPLAPSPHGAHTWLPSAYNPKTGMAYLPLGDMAWTVEWASTDPNWRRPKGNIPDGGLKAIPSAKGHQTASYLIARDVATNKEIWRAKTVGGWNGGVMTTAGNLVFQGQTNGNFVAYDAKTGKVLWTFNAQAAVIAPPITYRAGGKQYVSVLTGMSTSAGAFADRVGAAIDYRTQARRVLTFAIGGTQTLPKAAPVVIKAADDPDFKPDGAKAARGALVYGQHCVVCHGSDVISGGTGPDLRASAIPVSADTFRQIVHDGAIVQNGMPQFQEFTDEQLEDLRQYIRTEASKLRSKG